MFVFFFSLYFFWPFKNRIFQNILSTSHYFKTLNNTSQGNRNNCKNITFFSVVKRTHLVGSKTLHHLSCVFHTITLYGSTNFINQNITVKLGKQTIENLENLCLRRAHRLICLYSNRLNSFQARSLCDCSKEQCLLNSV